MRKVYAIIILFFCFTTFAQSIAIVGVIKDGVTKEPIISASVGVQNSGLGTITNEECLSIIGTKISYHSHQLFGLQNEVHSGF